MPQSSLYHTAADGHAFAGDPGYTIPDECYGPAPEVCDRCGAHLHTAKQQQYGLCDNHIMETENELAAYWSMVEGGSPVYQLASGDYWCYLHQCDAHECACASKYAKM
jgi:hypothetical protein